MDARADPRHIVGQRVELSLAAGDERDLVAALRVPAGDGMTEPSPGPAPNTPIDLDIINLQRRDSAAPEEHRGRGRSSP
jgi:hypothetical protein